MNNKSYCKNCGAEIKQGDVFCAGCGCAVTAEQTQDSQQYFADNQAAAQPVYVTGAGTAAKKKISNKMIGIIISTAVVLIAIIGIIVAVCVNNSDVSDLLGTWKDPSDGDVVAAFNDNGTMYWDGYIMRYEITGSGEITTSYPILMRDSDLNPIDIGVEEFLENYAENYIKEKIKLFGNVDEIDTEEVLYYRLVEDDMYNRLYMEDEYDELEERIMDDEYLTKVK